MCNIFMVFVRHRLFIICLKIGQKKLKMFPLFFSRIHNRIFNLKNADFSVKEFATKLNTRCNLFPFSYQRKKLHLLFFFSGLNYFLSDMVFFKIKLAFRIRILEFKIICHT